MGAVSKKTLLYLRYIGIEHSFPVAMGTDNRWAWLHPRTENYLHLTFPFPVCSELVCCSSAGKGKWGQAAFATNVRHYFLAYTSCDGVLSTYGLFFLFTLLLRKAWCFN